MTTTYSPYSLELLPVDGILNPAASAEDIRGRLVNTLGILDGILGEKYGLSVELREQIHAVRFHVVNGIAFIDGFLQLGHAAVEPASSVEGLQAAIDSHVVAVKQALPLWQTWLREATANAGPNDAPLPRLMTVPDSTLRTLMQQMSDPLTTRDYVVIGAVALGLYGLVKLFSK